MAIVINCDYCRAYIKTVKTKDLIKLGEKEIICHKCTAAMKKVEDVAPKLSARFNNQAESLLKKLKEEAKEEFVRIWHDNNERDLPEKLRHVSEVNK